MSALQLYDTTAGCKQAEIAAAMTLEALIANMKPYDARLHEVRGFPGAVRSARIDLKRRRRAATSSRARSKTKVQDAYSMRSTPQVIGAAHDAVAWARTQVEIELNGVGDNPIFLAEKTLTLTGANFQGTPVSLPMDMIGAAVTMVCVLSERRMNRLTNPALSRRAARLPHEGRRHVLRADAQPVHGRHADRRAADPLAAGVDPVDPGRRGPGGLRLDGHEHGDQELADPRQRLRRSRDRVHGGGAGARFPGVQARPRHAKAKEVVRRHVKFLDIDRPLYPDHTRMKELVKSCEILDAVEAAVGPLG